MGYADGTSVSKGRTLAEIETTLLRFGCSSFAQGTQDDPPLAMIGFAKDTISYRVTLPLPSSDLREFHESPTGRRKYTQREARAK
jgi:hypothetical protein